MSELNDLERLQEHIRARVAAEGLRPLAAKLGLEVGVIRSAQDARNMKFSTLMRLLDALGWNWRMAPKSTLADTEAESELDRIERICAEATPGPAGRGGTDHTILTAIAMDNRLGDRTRARADLILRAAFADPDAEKRSSQRAKRNRDDLARAELVVNDAIEETGAAVPSEIRGHLVNLVRIYKVDPETVRHLLYDLSRV